MAHLLKPFTVAEIRQNLDANGYISGDVLVDLSDIIDNDLEGFLDIISEKLVGNDLLMDITYEVAGGSKDGVVINVTGDPSIAIDDEN